MSFSKLATANDPLEIAKFDGMIFNHHRQPALARIK
jgi:hypothetical protein